MATWQILLLILCAGGLIWLAFHIIRGNPAEFNRENLSKSFYTVGVLAIMIIILIVLCVVMLRT